jgi:purine-nucleoside phosphorylase
MSYTPLEDKKLSFEGTDGAIDLDDVVINSSSSFKNNRAMNEAIDNEFRQALSQPLTAFTSNSNNHADGNANSHQLPQLSADPFYVFRDDLYRQLSRVDETLAEYLRVVHQTVR